MRSRNKHNNPETQIKKLQIREEQDLEKLEKADPSKVEELSLRSLKKSKDKIINKTFQKDWPKVHTLDLIKVRQLQAKNFEKIMNQGWPNLKSITLSQSSVQEEGLEFLFLRQLKNLEKLNIFDDYDQDTGLTAHCLQNIIEHKYEKLRFLKFKQNKIGSSGIKLLIKSTMPLLKRLGLEFCFMGNEGAKHLAKGHWPKLQVLTINDNEILFDGHFEIMKGGWKKLRKFRAGTCSQQSYNIVLDPISYMMFVAFQGKNIKMLMQYMSYVNDQMVQDVNAIFNHRYTCHEEDQQEESQNGEDFQLG